MMSLEDTEPIFQQVLTHKRYLLINFRFIYLLIIDLKKKIIDLSLQDEFWPVLLLTSFLSFRTGNPLVVNKTAVPPCADEPSKKVFEQAITGALCKHVIGYNAWNK